MKHISKKIKRFCDCRRNSKFGHQVSCMLCHCFLSLNRHCTATTGTTTCDQVGRVQSTVRKSGVFILTVFYYLRLSIFSSTIDNLCIVNPCEVVELFSCDHEGCQVGRVDGEEDESEHGPNIGHTSCGIPSRTVHIYSCLEKDRPYQPQRPTQ